MWPMCANVVQAAHSTYFLVGDRERRLAMSRYLGIGTCRYIWRMPRDHRHHQRWFERFI